MSKQVDYIIVGQGLAGSALAMECLQRGKTVMVFDEPDRNRASVFAAGICNPITGKAMTRTYLAERLFPFLQVWYTRTEQLLQEKFFRTLPIYRPFHSPLEQQQWVDKSTGDSLRDFVHRVWTDPYLPEYLNNPHGGIEIGQSGVLDVQRWVGSVRKLLREKDMYRPVFFDERQMQVGAGVRYDDVHGSHVIFCNGMAALQSSYMGWLPLKPLKGETVTIRMDFPGEKIISRGIYIVPSRVTGEFVVGATYQHEPFSAGTSGEGREYLLHRLKEWISVPWELIHQDWGIRPTVTDRRPLLGNHPAIPNVLIFNGLGTKGVSLAPYFAAALLDWLDKGATLPEEVNISRFKALYSN